LQEVILRSALQHLLMHFLTGRFAKARIIATTTLIAAATHQETGPHEQKICLRES
jgi:hypothetical protein